MSSLLGLSQPKNNFIKDAVMPAPNAASLGKYGDIPVSAFTGIPSISIPIYTLKEGPIDLPISIDYHGSGIKINENASWVGLGWSLNAGGIITRTVLGLPDEINSYGYLHTSDEESKNLLAVENLLADNEPDIFSYNISGYTGKFVIDKNGECLQTKRSDVKIQVFGISGFDIYFLILTPEGTRYLFQGVKEMTKIWRNNFLQFQEYPSSWYLSSISSADQKYTINLNYSLETYGVNTLPSCSETQTVYNYTGYAPITTNCGNLPPLNVSDVTGKRLSSITTSTAIISFIGGTREDMEPGYQVSNTASKLETIEITEGTFCKRFNFNYDYFVDNPSLGSFHKQLKLIDLKETSCDNSLFLPAYEFTYDGPLINGKQFLPNRRSKAIDHWGFYNGAHINDNLNFFAGRSVVDVSNFGGGIQIFDGGAKRESEEIYMKYGVLKKIKYPTGGETSFEFEANRANVIYPDPDLEIENLVKLENCTPTYSTGTCCGNTTQEQTIIFTQIQKDESFIFCDIYDINFFEETRYDPCYSSSSTYNIDYYLEVRRLSDNFLVGAFSANMIGSNDPNSPYPKEYHPSLSFNDLEVFGQINPGTAYKFILTVSDGVGKFRIDHHKTQDPQKIVGGLRIKKIISSENLSGGMPIEKEYFYNMPDGKSSGILNQLPQYASIYAVNGLFLTLFFDSYSIVPLGDFDGYHIGYKLVEERFKDNGKIVYEFYRETNSDLGFPSGGLPLEPIPPSIKNGKSKKTIIYTQTGAKISETKHEPDVNSLGYSYLGPSPIRYRKLFAGVVPPSIPPTPIGIAGGWAYNQYFLKQSFFRIERDSILQDGVERVTTYSYDPGLRHTKPVSITTVNSDNKIHKIINKYVFDWENSDIRTEMITRNMIGSPVETIAEVNSVQVSGNRIEFSFFDSNGLPSTIAANNHPYPYRFYEYERTWINALLQPGNWIHQGTINSYYPNNNISAKGYPKQFTKANWLTESYEWNRGLLTKRTYGNFNWIYSYYSNSRLLASLTDIDGQVTNYFYDKLMRLKTVSARNGNVTTNYTYQYHGTSNPKNYIEAITSFAQVSTQVTLSQKAIREYLDGLGRPIQKLLREYHPTKGANGAVFGKVDVITNYEYDNQGRLIRVSRPYQGYNDGRFFYPGGIDFTLNQYESSPLNRVIGVTPPSGHTTTTTYGKNSITFTVPGTSLVYPVNSLNETKIIDPDNRVTITYTDKKGRVILTRQTNTSGFNPADTYQQYDDKDRLITVVPPGATVNSGELIYKYEYSGDNLLLKKKIPGSSESLMRYNNMDLLVFSQDGNLLQQNKSIGVKYDSYGRSIETGFVVGLPDPNLNFLFSESLSKNYYDGHDGVNQINLVSNPQYLGKIRRSEFKVLDGGNSWLHTNFTYDSYGRISASSGNNYLNVNSSTAESYSNSYDFADNLYRQLRNHNPGSTGTTGNRSITYDWHFDHGGRLVNYFINLDGFSQHLSEQNYNFYDQIIERNLGSTFLNNTYSWLQSVDYSYNNMGWLTSINNSNHTGSAITFPTGCSPNMPNPGTAIRESFPENNDLFYLELRYDQLFSTAGLSGSAQKTGNISQIAWRTRGRDRQAYSFNYDYLSRLSSATYFDINGAGTASTTNRYNESLTYDIRGNITSLQRNGYFSSSCNYGQIDQLTYSYTNNSNRLATIIDAAPSNQRQHGFNPGSGGVGYTYDANGNLKSDSYKGITSISYNYLNLPSVINYSNGNRIEWVYDSRGTKLRKIVKVGATVQYEQDYINGLEYRKVGAGNRRLEAIYHAEGRYYNLNVETNNTLNWRKEYTIKDHLGNSRIAFTDKNGNGIVDVTNISSTNDVIQENGYYPFGLNHNGPWLMNDAAKDNGYQYNSKELNDDFGLGWSDYGARWYDAAIGRWNALDPMAESYYTISPYAYVANNPLVFIDPDGMRIVWGDDDASEALRHRVMTLYNDSKIFRTIYDYLDGIDQEISVIGDDTGI
ncbi:MAG: RHS repeat-associated core domain-containing protein [Bacteroidota bacterium]|nr:RHS repeat-associated core domain-containing protein [Bacteroidota bacterium]